LFDLELDLLLSVHAVHKETKREMTSLSTTKDSTDTCQTDAANITLGVGDIEFVFHESTGRANGPASTKEGF
jgi:hypothetical protein